MEKENMVVMSETEFNAKIEEYQNAIDKLRVDGTDKIKQLNFDILTLKNNKKISKETKEALIAQNKEMLVKAKEVKEQNKAEIGRLVKEATAFARTNYKQFHDAKKAEAAEMKAKTLETYVAKVNEINSSFAEKLAALDADHEAKVQAAGEDKVALKEVNSDYKAAKKNLVEGKKQVVFETKVIKKDGLQAAKDKAHASYRHLEHIVTRIKDGKLNPIEQIKNKAEKYVYNFNIGKFLMKNGLFIIIFLFIIICLIIAPNLLSINHGLLILKNFSTRVFFALGVAGLILLGGTDLAIGRIVTVTTMFSCALLNPESPVEFFGLSISGLYNQIGVGGTVVIAILVSILLSVAFSALSGFLTAKFKIHPFISTLGTSLIAWGLISFATNNMKTGAITDEVSKISANIPGTKISLVIIYALIAIAIVWFIWNKTKFGKNMYAVGGNQEAAAVSGINVFWVTLGVFIMAGVLYGIGGFIQSTVSGSSSTGTGQGWELEAIAACVIGGISFTGGIGKISGAVFGCLLFEIMKYLLRGVFGGNQDIANIFIGAIILVAVTFDSLKYLKKK